MVREKERLFAIGKTVKHRAFRNILKNLKNLRLRWRSNHEYWNVLLFLDDAASHHSDLKLKNVKIVFFSSKHNMILPALVSKQYKNFKFLCKSLILKDILLQNLLIS